MNEEITNILKTFENQAPDAFHQVIMREVCEQWAWIILSFLLLALVACAYRMAKKIEDDVFSPLALGSCWFAIIIGILIIFSSTVNLIEISLYPKGYVINMAVHSK